eukprot:XP_011673987.1 PREDICTED: probable JmjC domain-containing histone demethylation protein 2C isoform X1 [Strongylocentrotus purpuratus]
MFSHAYDSFVNSLLKGENVGITRRTNRATNNPAVTTQATTTTHTRTAPRSHSPSHAPSGPQPTVVSSTSSSSSGGGGSSKKKRKDKDHVTPVVSTPPVSSHEHPEKADKTLEKAGKEKAPGSCSSAPKSKKERKRKSDEQVEEEKKLPTSTSEKRPRSNSGFSESPQERVVELSKGETPDPSIPSGESVVHSVSVSKPDKVWQSNTPSVQVEPKPREDSDVSCNSSKAKSKAVNKQEQAISSDKKDSRSSTPDSVKKHKQKAKKEHRPKQPVSIEVTPQETPASDQSRLSVSTSVTTTVSKQMVESKTEGTGPAGLRPPIPEKEAKRKNFGEFPPPDLREQSLTSAIAGIIARELNRDSDISSSVGKKTEPNLVPSDISTKEIQPSSISDRPVNSGPITTTSYTSSNLQSVLPNRTIATSNSVPVISHGNGGLTGLPGMDRNSYGITSENTKLSNSTNISSKSFAPQPVLGERIARPEVRDPRRETSSSTSEKSEGGKSSSSTDRSRDSDQSRSDKKSTLVADLRTPVQVYRDPNLSDSEVIHVDSIQHHPTHSHLMKIGDHHSPSPGQHPITPSPHSALRNPSATAAPAPGANPSAIVASPSAFVAAPSVGHIPAHHPIQHQHHAMFPAHLQLYQQHPLASQLVMPGHFPQHHLAGLDRHSLQQLHAQGIVGLVQPDPMARIRMGGGLHGIVSPQHAATALQGSMHPGLTQAQLQALHQQHGLPLPPSWVIQHEELERAHLQQQKSQAAAVAAAEKGPSSLPPHHPSAPTSQDRRIDPAAQAALSADKKPHPSHLPGGGVHPQHAQHHVHPQLIAVSQAAQAAQGLVGHESAAAAAVAAHHAARHQYQELDAQAAVQQHFQESLRKLQVPFSFSTPTAGGSITEGTALPKNKGQLPKEVVDRQHKERQELEERLRREREEKELEWQRIQREKERKHQDSDPRLRFPGVESESVYKHPVSEGKHPYDDPHYRQSLAHAGLVRYQDEFVNKYPMEVKQEPKIKLERTDLNARTHDGQGFKTYQSSVRSDAHTTYYNTMSMKSEEPRAGVPVRTEQNRQMASASAYKPKPDNLVGYQPFLHTISSHGGEKGDMFNKHNEEYKMAANAAAMQGARRIIPTPPPLIKREPDRSEMALHSSVIQASRSERRPEMMHHSAGVFTAAGSNHDIHLTQAGKHVALSDSRTNNDVSHSVPVIKHTIGTPPPLHSSAQQTTASQLVRQSHIPPQSPLKVATPQQLSAAVLQLGSHSVSSTTTTTMGVYAHQVYSTAQTTTATSSSSLLMSALRPQDMTRVSEAMEVDQGTMKRKPSHTAAVFHKKRPKTKDDVHSDSGNSEKKESTGMSYIEQYHNFVMEPSAHNTSVGAPTVCKATENIELKIEKVDQYKRLSLDSSAPASLMSAESHRTTNGTWSDSESNRCVSPRSTASDSSEGRSLKSASPHRAGGPVYLKKAWLARHSESKTPFGVPTSGASSTNNLDPKQEPGLSTKLSNSLPNGHLMSGTFAQVAQSMEADKSVTIDDIPKSIPNHVYDFDQDKSSTCSEASTVSSHKSRSKKSGKDRTKKKDRKRHGSPADPKKHGKDKGDKSEEKLVEAEKPKSEYVLGLEACRIMSNNVESKSTQQITELLNLIAQTPKKRKLTRSSKDNKDGQLNRPVAKPTVTKLKKSGEAFLQDGYCSEITPNLMKCRECRIKPSSKQSKLNNIFCRFYAFRRLKYSNKGNLTIAGFSEPEQCDSEDLSPWLPYPPDTDSNLDLETCLYILSRVGPQFCQLVQQEQQAKTWCPTPGKIAWKRAVIGVREMCDTCDTTLFNIHWTCSKCGFVVCLDCYHSKSDEEKNDENTPENGSKWLKCIKDQVHQPDSLMLTQMIPGNALWDVGDLMHQVCAKWRIQSACPCLGDTKPTVNGMSPTSSQVSREWKRDDLLSSTALSGHIANARTNRMPKLTSLPVSASPLDFLADIATSQDGKRNFEGKRPDTLNSKSADKACSVDVDAKGEPCSTLRDLLTKTAGKLVKPSPNDGNLLTPFLPKADGISKKTSRTMTSTFEDIIATVVEQNISAPGKDRNAAKTPRLSTSSVSDTTTSPCNIRLEKKVKNLANRNTLVESSVMYPDVPHSWLCDGRLLRLHDPSHAGNLRIFQEQWRKGEPILVSNVHKQLDDNLWHPNFFNKHFGHLENDLVDCRSGDVITGAPMRDFWNGFEDISNRLETKQGLPIILKLKDWPPAQDFSELLPQHFQDLMNNLPLPDYTRRDGRFNLSSRLPDFFVKPDLGPKMYNAYGLARYAPCGTTNLHLDISDAVNVMVYVGKPHSVDGNETCDSYEKEAVDAVDHMCMDEQTKQRVREKEERPGAIWHLFRAADTNKMRQFLIKLSQERGEDVPPDHDPIHDQSWYLDNELLDRLYKEYGVQGWAIAQCWGDAIFIPAGAPHQVS